MKFQIIYILLCIYSLNIFSQDSSPSRFSNKLIFSLDGGMTISKTDYPDAKIGERLTGGFEYFLPASDNHLFGFKIFGGGQEIVNEARNKIINIPGIGTDTLPNIINTDAYLLGIGLIYSISLENYFYPYFTGGITNLWFSPKLENGRLAPFNQERKYIRNTIVYDLSLGIRYSISDNFSIKLESGFHFANTDNLDDISTGQNKDFYATSLIGVSYTFAGSSDNDEDGILNEIDECPDEPEDFDSFNDSDGCPDPDNDGDGIPDILDKCPDTPEDFDSFRDEDGCADIDNDLDGILDEVDQCPDESEDFDGFEDEDGCPELDNDEDGVADSVDRCPDIVGTQANNGCPEDGTTEESENTTAPKEIVIEGEATFSPGSADIIPEARAELDRIVKLLQLYPDENWRIEGHTDSHEAKNLMVRSLSLRRAETILNYFISKGLPSYQFRVFDMGDRFPIANNNTEYGRMKNRRVVLVREN
jgi:outer membrane protein OmpA-like peptidoglycan-associated protein